MPIRWALASISIFDGIAGALSTNPAGNMMRLTQIDFLLRDLNRMMIETSRA